MHHLVTREQMAHLETEALTRHGMAGRILMETAGRALAQVAARTLGDRHDIMWVRPRPRRGRAMPPVVVVCGPGNNGGDGFVAARVLAARGVALRIYVFAERERLAGDALAAFRALQKDLAGCIHFVDGARVLRDLQAHLLTSTLVVDCLLGVGATGDVHGRMREGIALIRSAGVPVVSADIPSGICADTGAVLGEAIRAEHTVTFGLAKRGHYLFPGADHRGTLHVADLGIPLALVGDRPPLARVIFPNDGPRLLPRRQVDAHKGTYGHLVVVAGSALSPGAASLCVGAALRAGAGLVSLACDEATWANARSVSPEAMLHLRGDQDDAGFAATALGRASAVTVGPGMGTGAAAVGFFGALLEASTVPMCLDADALGMLAAQPALWASRRCAVVITPHPKEMARLLGIDTREVQKDRVGSALQVARQRRCTVILKGAGTVVADRDGEVVVVAAGNPGMARGGTGDVLAGMVGALLAQKMPPMRAAEAAAVLHAAAGDAAAARRGQAGMCTTDVIEALGHVLRSWRR